MNKRLAAALFIAVFVFLSAAIANAEKNSMGKMQKTGMMCDMSKMGRMGGMSKKIGMDDKIMKKAGFFIRNSEELGLSDKQIIKIKALKVEVKKELIQKNADIEILGIDIQTGMSANSIDADAVNSLIGKKYDLKKAKAQYLVTKYVELKNILTADQTVKLKELWKQCKTN